MILWVFREKDLQNAGTIWNQNSEWPFGIRGLTFERFKYSESLNFDVLVLTELWRNEHKFVNGTMVTMKWTHGVTVKNKKGGVKFPSDRAVGVGIMLSDRARKKCITHGSLRVTGLLVWVRLKGPVCNIFVIGATYHTEREWTRTRHNKTQSIHWWNYHVETTDRSSIRRLHRSLIGSEWTTSCQHSWCNGQVGTWWNLAKRRYYAGNGLGCLICSQWTLPSKRKSFQRTQHTTFMRTAASSSLLDSDSPDLASIADIGQYVGRTLTTEYRGEQINGKVVEVEKRDTVKSWVIQFEDGYVLRCNEKWLEQRLKPLPKEKIKRQLDYILVSNRWKSSVSWGCKSMLGTINSQK